MASTKTNVDCFSENESLRAVVTLHNYFLNHKYKKWGIPNTNNYNNTYGNLLKNSKTNSRANELSGSGHEVVSVESPVVLPKTSVKAL